MFKVKLNFRCNGLSKKEGDILSPNDLNIIGHLLNGLISNDILEEIPVDPKPIKKKRNRKKVT